MKNIKILSVLLFGGLLFATSCQKPDPAVIAPTINKEIKGNITYQSGSTTFKAAKARVFLTNGTKTASVNYDESAVADSAGNYSIKGLQLGDYYLTASYTDVNGFTYTTPGYGVTLANKDGALTVDMVLK